LPFYYFYVIIEQSVTKNLRDCEPLESQMFLDVSRLPREALVGEGSTQINLASVLLGLRVQMEDMARCDLIKANMSFGFAAAKPVPKSISALHDWTSYKWNWDDPYDFTWFVAGWGPESSRYIANAVRKLRAALRKHMDTLQLRMEYPDAFQDVVGSVDDDGNFVWGDYPYGGAVFVPGGDMVYPCSCSALLEVQDHAMSMTAGGLVISELLQVTRPEQFGPNS
jgi:hypothetical protein